MGVHLMGVHLMRRHFMGMHLIGVHLIRIHFMDMHLIGAYVTGLCLMGVYLMGMWRRQIVIPRSQSCEGVLGLGGVANGVLPSPSVFEGITTGVFTNVPGINEKILIVVGHAVKHAYAMSFRTVFLCTL